LFDCQIGTQICEFQSEIFHVFFVLADLVFQGFLLVFECLDARRLCLNILF